MDKAEIIEQSPEIPEYGGGKWAMYSIGCCWWTSFPDDLGQKPPVKAIAKPPDGSGIAKFDIVPDSGGISLPCCPHCGSLLMQAPLEKFIAAAEKQPEHYGKYGVASFFQAHSRHSEGCWKKWDHYFWPPEPRRFA